MNRPIIFTVLFVATAVALGAQDASKSNPYEGTSNPPSDDQIETSSTPEAKPPAGKPLYSQPAAPTTTQPRTEIQPTSSVDPAANYPEPGTDDGIVRVAPSEPARPVFGQRAHASDPDSDIVHVGAMRPGELAAGTAIRVKLLQRLSTTDTENGEAFRTRVATDVVQGSEVLIPAGSEIEGKVVSVSSGHVGGHGSMRLRPDTVIMPDGKRYRLSAETTGTAGANTHVGSEGTIVPGSRMKRNGLEYGGAVGVGATTGAIVGGPVGALTGSLIGAGVVTAHLLATHPQATLKSGTTLMFTLTEPLNLVPADVSRY
jgi:hypothetical protein